MLDGKQYVSVLAGRGNGRMYTLVLDGKEPASCCASTGRTRRTSTTQAMSFPR